MSESSLLLETKMMISKRLPFKTILILCSISLVGCGSSGSDKTVSDIDESSQPSTPAENTNGTLPSTPPAENNEVDLLISWDDNSDNEVEFLIERRLASNVDAGESIGVAPNTTSYVDTQIQSGGTYCYRIIAKGVNDGLSPSAEVCIDV
jgi:hypothetical protein